jgi:hypothetical protein
MISELFDFRHPSIICRAVGHKRERYLAGYYQDRRGYPRERWYSRCVRCGTTDGGEVFREGWVERLTISRALWRVREARGSFAAWRRSDCEDCGMPNQKYGRPVGDHSKCNPIPF